MPTSLSRKVARLAAGVAVYALCGCSAASQVARVPYQPVDEASAEPALYATRSALLDALRRKDKDALDRWISKEANGSVIAREVTTDKLALGLESAELLNDLLIHGGEFVEPGHTRFCAPYWVARLLDSTKLPDHLVFEGWPWAVVVPKSVVRSRPDASAPEVGSLSLELIQVFEFEPADPANRFVAIKYGRSRAFVERADVREIDNSSKACFELVDGTWLLSTFW